MYIQQNISINAQRSSFFSNSFIEIIPGIKSRIVYLNSWDTLYLQVNYQSASTRLVVLEVINDCLTIYLQKVREENDLQFVRLSQRCS